MSSSDDFECESCNPFACYTVSKPRKKKPNGYRKIKYFCGEYIGETKDVFIGKARHGQGKFVWKDGDTYEGGWEKGKMHGKGKYVYEDGSCYEGEFKERMLKNTRTIKKTPLNNVETIFLQNTAEIHDEKVFTKQDSKNDKKYINVIKGEKLPQDNFDKKSHLKLMYSCHSTSGGNYLDKPICDLPNANGRKSYYISDAACHGAFVDKKGNNLIDKIKDNIKGTNAVGFFSHADKKYTILYEDTIDKNGKLGTKRSVFCKEGVNVNDDDFNANKDRYFHYYCILNEGTEQNIYKIPHQLCYWRETLIDDNNTSDKNKYPNKFMEAIHCLKQGEPFTFTTQAQVDVGDKLVEKEVKITISGTAEMVEVVKNAEQQLEIVTVKNNSLEKQQIGYSNSINCNNQIGLPEGHSNQEEKSEDDIDEKPDNNILTKIATHSLSLIPHQNNLAQ